MFSFLHQRNCHYAHAKIGHETTVYRDQATSCQPHIATLQTHIAGSNLVPLGYCKMVPPPMMQSKWWSKRLHGIQHWCPCISYWPHVGPPKSGMKFQLASRLLDLIEWTRGLWNAKTGNVACWSLISSRVTAERTTVDFGEICYQMRR